MARRGQEAHGQLNPPYLLKTAHLFINKALVAYCFSGGPITPGDKGSDRFFGGDDNATLIGDGFIAAPPVNPDATTADINLGGTGVNF